MERIGRYEVVSELGRGSMGAVYKARDPQIGRTVAIKIILTANLSAEALEQYKQRFMREAQAAGQMSHPGIVTIHDIAEDASGQPFLVMEFIEGIGLDRLLVPGAERLPVERCLDIGIQVAEALEYAHRRGVVHRDIKPANILLTHDGRAKIADFGIAKLAGVQLTQTGQMMGTPAFMSPEQFSGGAVDARSDLFSLGAMLYWMLTGEKPFGGESLTVVSFRVVYTEPIPANRINPALPPELETVLARCLAKNPADRYASCRELAEDLKAIQGGRAIKTQPVPVPAPMDQTVATVAPLSSGAGMPLGTLPAAAEATKQAIPVVGVPVEVEPLGFWAAHKRKLIAAALLLLLAVLLGYWFWPSAGTEETQTDTTTEPAPPPKPKRATTTKTTPRQQPAAQPAETTPSPEEILRQKGEEILQQKAEEILGGTKQKTKPGKGKGRHP
jgi:serine/threonine-protein kinase